MSDYDRTDRGAYITLGVVFGAMAGICAGMLLAPRTGEEMRDYIRSRALEAKEKTQAELRDKRDAGREKLLSKIEQSKEVADRAADKAKELADKASVRTREATS